MIILTSFAADVMDKVISSLPKSPKELSIIFIPTAADPYENKDWMNVDRKKLVDLGFNVSDFDLKDKKEDEVKKALKNIDIVFVSGGNTFYLLSHARKSGFEMVVKDLLEKDLTYIGSSAGSVLLGPSIEPIKYLDDPSVAPDLSNYSGLAIVNFITLPHYDNKKYNSYYEKLEKEYKNKYILKPLDDNQAIIIDKDKNILVTN